MKRKRFLVILLGLVLIVAVVACGNKETGKESDDKKTGETVQSEVEDDKADVEVDEEAETTGDNTQAETPENTQSESTQSAEPIVTKTTMYAKSNVNVRSGAGASNAQIGSLTKGQEVVKVGDENGWSKIEFNGGIGYVSSKYLSAEKVSASTANSKDSNASTNNTPNTGRTVPSTPAH